MTTKSKPCGCKDSPCSCDGPKSAVACRCGGAGCELCQSGNFVRPRFFAGQLLTEEDLELLSSYMLEKNRLHNRHLFGAGVVCGLEVVPHPCGGGKVTVEPGYALDCCGNDIVLTCTQELDINTMVRELRVKQHGYDCGDPCAKPSTGCDDSAKEEADESSDTGRTFCLYIRYCEKQTDPVSPYVTEDACGVQPCEPTRIREGVRFELRCDEKDDADDLCDHIHRCLKDLKLTKTIVQQAAKWLNHSWRVRDAVRQYVSSRQVTAPGPAPAPPSEPQTQRTAMAAVAAQAQAVDFAEVRQDLFTIRAIATDKDSEFIPSCSDCFFRIWRPVLELRRAGTEVPLEKIKEIEEFEGLDIVKMIRDAGANTAAKQTDPIEKLLIEENAILLADEIGKKGAVLPDRELPVALAGLGVTHTEKVQRSIDKTFLSTTETLLDGLSSAGQLTPGLEARISSARRALTARGKLTVDSVSHQLAEIQTVTEIQLRAFIRCVCSVLMPPCSPCDDTAVLLACLDLKNCKVTDVCNMKRTFVLSPAAVRYWFPWLRRIGELLEGICCGDVACAEAANSTAGGGGASSSGDGVIDRTLDAFRPAFSSSSSAKDGLNALIALGDLCANLSDDGGDFRDTMEALREIAARCAGKPVPPANTVPPYSASAGDSGAAPAQTVATAELKKSFWDLIRGA